MDSPGHGGVVDTLTWQVKDESLNLFWCFLASGTVSKTLPNQTELPAVIREQRKVANLKKRYEPNRTTFYTKNTNFISSKATKSNVKQNLKFGIIIIIIT